MHSSSGDCNDRANGLVSGLNSALVSDLQAEDIIFSLRRKEIKDCLSDDTSSLDHSRLVGVLYIVVETGIIYIILFMIYLLLTAEVFARPLGGAWAEYWICQLSVCEFRRRHDLGRY